MHNICHIEIPSICLKTSKEFYENVFGWKVEIAPDMSYAMWEPGEGPGGGFNPVKETCSCSKELPEMCSLFYIKVDCIESKTKDIEAAGGKILKTKTEVAGYGYYAIFEDPAGGVVAIWQSKEK
ncbi:MAG: VOC family protein [bacterium]